MSEMYNIQFVGTNLNLYKLYHNAIKEKNNLDNGPNKFRVRERIAQSKEELTDENSLNSIIFIQHKQKDSSGLEIMKGLLDRDPFRHILLFVAPEDRGLAKEVYQLEEKYPLATLDIVVQPIQPARIWEFLDRVTEKHMNFEWEDGDLDEL